MQQLIMVIRFNKTNKYGAKKTVIDGITFDSKAEAEYYALIKQQEKLNMLKIVELQPKIYLTDAKILYKPDFLIHRLGETSPVYIDVKGCETPVFKIKARLWASYMDADLELVKKKGKRFYTTKTIKGLKE